MSTPVPQTVHLFFTIGYDYGENLSTILNINPDNLDNLQLPIYTNESFGVEWKNVVFNTSFPIMLKYRESVRDINGIYHPYDIKQTLEVWYDTAYGNPSLTHTFYDWLTTYRIEDLNITDKLVDYNVDLSRVKKVRYTTYDGAKDYVNHPGNNFTLESFVRNIDGYDENVRTIYYIDPSSPPSSLSKTHMVFDFEGAPSTFEIFTDGNWSLSDNASWLSCSPTSGSGSAIVTVDPGFHKFIGSRHATITVNVNGGNETISVTQYDSNA